MKLDVSIFDPYHFCWKKDSVQDQPVDLSEFSIATFNIWFDSYLQERRNNSVFEIMEAESPDFIAFQEVTESSLQRMASYRFFQKYFRVSDVLGDDLGDYGNILLSKHPVVSFKSMRLPSFMGRRLVVAEIKLEGNSNLCLATVHLESFKANTETRKEQLEVIFEYLSNFDQVIVAGDFNFCHTYVENDDFLPFAYSDNWSHLKPGEDGFTEDTSINEMRYRFKGKHKQVRFDRILSKGLVPLDIKLLGTGPIPGLDPPVFPSDHFGLIGKFRMRDILDRTVDKI